MDQFYKLTLSNGREINGLRMNGNNFISATAITADMFEGGLAPVIISGDGTMEVHEHMELVQIAQMNGEYWFVLRDMSQKELDEIRIRADVDFIAMMSDIEL